jgi:hypothetical protein
VRSEQVSHARPDRFDFAMILLESVLVDIRDRAQPASALDTIGCVTTRGAFTTRTACDAIDRIAPSGNFWVASSKAPSDAALARKRPMCGQPPRSATPDTRTECD